MTRDTQLHPAILALADGTVFHGTAFGAPVTGVGEAVFNTSMTGYQEILTDPSYAGQIVAMTYPEIGNTGVNAEDVESAKPHVKGFIVRHLCRTPSNYRARGTLDSFLREHGIPGIEGIDTRQLTRILRDRGAQMAAFSAVERNPDDLVDLARAAGTMEGQNLVPEVTCRAPYEWVEPVTHVEYQAGTPFGQGAVRARFSVVAYDFGIKRNILRLLVDHGCRVTVVPAATPASAVRAMNPDGVFLSNGPGDPAACTDAIAAVRDLVGVKPVFGICLGHQILSLALGCTTYKLKFGHRGGNQPVMDLTTRKTEITSQNHGFAVRVETMPKGLALTHINLNDHTAEGVAYPEGLAFAVQYHPEASPGPHDAQYLFARFLQLMETGVLPAAGAA